MVNVKVLKLGLKVSSDTILVSVPWCGSQPTLRVWLTFNSSTDVWNVLCFEEWTSNGAHHGWTVFSSGLKFPNWSRQEMISVSLSFVWWTKMVVEIGNIILSALMWWQKSSPNKYSRVYCWHKNGGFAVGSTSNIHIKLNIGIRILCFLAIGFSPSQGQRQHSQKMSEVVEVHFKPIKRWNHCRQ